MSKSNSPETLNLIANELETMLTKLLGKNTYYVLIVSQDLSPEDLCNCVTNVPPERAPQLRKVFTELGQRQPQMQN